MFESLQAKFVSLLAFIILGINAASAVYTKNYSTSKLGGIAIGAVLLLLLILDVNCVVIGGCNAWAWLKFVLVLIPLVVILVLSILMFNVKETKTD